MAFKNQRTPLKRGRRSRIMTVFVDEAAQRVSMTLPLKVAPKQALRIFIALYRENS